MFNSRPFLIAIAAVFTLLPARAQEAKLWLPSLFADRMVLQREKPVPVWGKAAPGETVSVQFEDQKLSTKADADGRWRVDLAPLKASKEGRDLAVSAGKDSRTIRQVVVGEVWLMSGQSNMAFLMSSILRTPEIVGSERRTEAAKAGKGPSQIKAEKDMAEANDPLLRTYRVFSISAERPREDAVTSEGWMEWNKKNAPNFAAMAFYFGQKLRQVLDVPVGIVMCSWGGSSACSWISADTLRSPALNTVFPEDVPEWGANLSPSRLYNGMLKPVAPYAISGFCWYQGETEATELQNAYIYRYLLPGLIKDWRAAWHENDLPFYLVQLPPLNNGERWDVVRESQSKALALPKTGMVPTLDIVPPGDLHPKIKHAVASRLADLALGDHYGKGTWPGLTLFDKAETQGATMRVHLTNAKGMKTTDGKAPAEFQLAGADKVFKPAEAVIDGETIVVKSAEVPAPVAVRYAFVQAPKVNLLNGGGIAVVPFRSDDWPVAGQEMVPQNLPVKDPLAVSVGGNNLLGDKAAPWIPSTGIAESEVRQPEKEPKPGREGKEKGALTASKSGMRIQVKGFAPRKDMPSSPAYFWTANPEVDPTKGLTMEVSTHLYEGELDIEAATKVADGTFRLYRVQALPTRVYTFQNFVGGRVPDNTQVRLLRSDMDDEGHVFRIAIRPDGVAQIYDGSKVIGTTSGEVLKGKDEKPYLRFGKTVEGGKWSGAIYLAAFDTGGAFAPGASAKVSTEERPDGEE